MGTEGAAGRPLAGLHVVVTRSAEQAGPLISLLEEAGAEPVLMPLIDIVTPTDGGAGLRNALDRLADHDWLVVASPNGAMRVGAAVADPVNSCVRIAAVGATTGDALPRVDLVSARQGAEGLVEAFPDGTGRVLVVQAEGGARTLVDGLTARGWTVHRVDGYATRAVVPTAAQQLAVFRADAVLFASGSAAVSWVDTFGTSTPPIVVAMGPQTAADAERAGLKVQVIAADHSLAGMLHALAESVGAG